MPRDAPFACGSINLCPLTFARQPLKPTNSFAWPLGHFSINVPYEYCIFNIFYLVGPQICCSFCERTRKRGKPPLLLGKCRVCITLQFTVRGAFSSKQQLHPVKFMQIINYSFPGITFFCTILPVKRNTLMYFT